MTEREREREKMNNTYNYADEHLGKGLVVRSTLNESLHFIFSS